MLILLLELSDDNKQVYCIDGSMWIVYSYECWYQCRRTWV